MFQDGLSKHVAINSEQVVQFFCGGVVLREEEETNKGYIVLLTNHLERVKKGWTLYSVVELLDSNSRLR